MNNMLRDYYRIFDCIDTIIELIPRSENPQTFSSYHPRTVIYDLHLQMIRLVAQNHADVLHFVTEHFQTRTTMLMLKVHDRYNTIQVGPLLQRPQLG